MARLERIEAGFYRIPLPEVLTDSTHGAMRAFEIVTARVRDADGAEGVGYTFTVGRNGGAVHDTLAREIAELAVGEDADLVEALWRRVWWALHYGGRGGARQVGVDVERAAEGKRGDIRGGRLLLKK